MNAGQSPAWDGQSGTAGGPAFGAALRSLAVERDVSQAELASAAGLDPTALETIFAGARRVTVSELARFTHALRLHPIEFLQRGALLSLDVYAAGLDPLYFLPSGQIRHDARIYMREINPRHRVPERDMLVRNPTLKALMADDVLDALGQIEVLLTYLLRAAIQQTGGIL